MTRRYIPIESLNKKDSESFKLFLDFDEYRALCLNSSNHIFEFSNNFTCKLSSWFFLILFPFFFSLPFPSNQFIWLCKISPDSIHFSFSCHSVCVCVCAKLLQSCSTLRDPMDCSPPGSSDHSFSRQEYWHGLPCPPPGALPDPGIEPASLSSPALAALLLAPPGQPSLCHFPNLNHHDLSQPLAWSPTS